MTAHRCLVSVLTALAFAAPLSVARPEAQASQPQAPPQLTVVVTPGTVTLELGKEATLTAVVHDASGRTVSDATVVFASQSRRELSVNAQGVMRAIAPGTYQVTVTAVPAAGAAGARQGGRGGGGAPNRTTVTVTVPEPPIRDVMFVDPPTRFYAGTTVGVSVGVTDSADRNRSTEVIAYASSAPAVATVNKYGQLRLLSVGAAAITASTGGVTASLPVSVVANPISRLEVSASRADARTGDVVHVSARAVAANGQPVTGAPIQYALMTAPAAGIFGAGAMAQIKPDGRFVAERSGLYTVVATTGSHTGTTTIEVTSRDIARNIALVGHGAVRDRHTSDLWVWEGVDGKDYAITGTWGADGHAYFWDVTDKANPEKIGEVKVDARTVNDVKVSEDGRIAVISREGASNRRNGFVIIDVSNPRAGLPILSTFDDELAGGVHNVFVEDNHVYALSAGQRYDIINIEDPKNPKRVGRFELDEPGASIHDVWVQDGIAYSSNWRNGVVAVDVGGGGKGGSPENPVKLGSYTYPSGWNHAAYPYVSQSTGKRYIFAADESFPEGTPTNRAGRAAGWVHVVDMTDWDHPEEVARYAVEDAGTHNLWVEDDKMYIGYYNGGLRVVDVSGELLGDLGRQGREIGKYYSYDPEGFIANAPMVWGPQPFKGHVFFSDFNSGLYIVRITDDPPPGRRGEIR
ncbi:MAG: hypothetical protein HQ485_05100 [Acidobacteria bacterium]|nr:hypothetical protein [Acidobacteriota bacterium]